jgi:hypothetical protein
MHLTERDPGYFFYSAVISPIQGDVLVWDTGASVLQARRLDDLSLRWNTSVRLADCATVSAGRGHIYASNYSDGPAGANAFMAEMLAKSPDKRYPRLTKSFLVLDASSGRVRAETTIATDEPMSVSMIIPGAHDDVFLGTDQALVRVTVKRSDS